MVTSKQEQTMITEKQHLRRIAVERRSVRRVAKGLIAAGYAISVNDGEEIVVKKSTKITEIVKATMSTDEDYFLVSKPGCKNSFVRFVYGNGGWDVICDYGMSLDD